MACSAESMKAEDKQYGPWLRATPDRLQKSHVVIGLQTGEIVNTGPLGAGPTERKLLLSLQATGSNERRQPHEAEETNRDRADVESGKLESESIEEKLAREKGSLDFEKQLREIDAGISGKVDMGCIAERVFKAWALESEVKVSANKMEDRGDGDLTQGIEFGLLGSGPFGDLGRTLVDAGPVKLNNSLANGMEPQLGQAGLKIPSSTERGRNKKAKSPTRAKRHAHAKTTEKENVRVGTSSLQKKNAMNELTSMEVEEVEAGPKRKACAPLDEILENVVGGKKPKLEEEVVAFGKLLAIQMGSVEAAM